MIRNKKMIDLRLAELSKELGFVQPIIKCFFEEKLVKADKELRHKIEEPLIKSSLEALLKKMEGPLRFKD